MHALQSQKYYLLPWEVSRYNISALHGSIVHLQCRYGTQEGPVGLIPWHAWIRQRSGGGQFCDGVPGGLTIDPLRIRRPSRSTWTPTCRGVISEKTCLERVLIYLAAKPTYPASKRHWPKAGSMLAHSLRRRPNIEPALGQGIVFAACPRSQQHATGHSAASFSGPH